MPAKIKREGISRPRLWTGRIIGGLAVAFLIFDGVTKIIQTNATVKGSEQLGYPADTTPVIGVILLICTAIYVIPKTGVFGAILLTGYLGGAIASHFRVGNGAFPIIFSGVYAVLIWISLVLREPQLFSFILMEPLPDKPQLTPIGFEE